MSAQQTKKILSALMVLLLLSMPLVHATELRLTYDANGNLITGDGKFRVYNSLNQLWKIYNGTSDADPLLEEYYHDPLEERIAGKIIYHNNGSIKEKVYYVSQNFVRVVNDSGTYDFRYVYNEGQLIAQQNPDGSKIFIHGNHEGSSSVVTNESGVVIENTTYSPYQEITSGGTKTRYTGEAKEYDTVVGDYDFNFRKYKPEWGIFLQPDTGTDQAYDPQQLNPYAFERHNPQKFKDEDGHRITYNVENVGNDKILAIYEDGGYRGRVVNEVEYTTKLNFNGKDYTVTTYDYDVQLGSKSNARGTLYAESYDCGQCGTTRLSTIYANNQKKLGKDENFDIAAGLGQDALTIAGYGASTKIIVGGGAKAISTTSNVATGIGVAQGLWEQNFKTLMSAFLPTNTYFSITGENGYKPFTQIAAYGSVRGGAGGRGSITGGGVFYSGKPGLSSGSGGYYGNSKKGSGSPTK